MHTHVIITMFSLTRRLFRPTAGFLKNIRLCQSNNGVALNDAEKKYETVSISKAVVLQPEKQNLSIQGWIQNIRKHKNVCFLDLTDKLSRTTLQVALARSLAEDMRLTVGTSVTCRGQLVESPGSKQRSEFQCEYFDVICECSSEILPYDLSRRSYAWNVLRNSYTARPQIKSMRSVFEIRSSVISALYQYFHQNGYMNITTPVITANNCEGGSEVFVVNARDSGSELFFDKEAYLSVSGQLHLEAVLNAFGKVFTIAPAFRAEKSFSRRHLSEFTMLEVEEAFINDLDVLMDRAEELIRFIAHHVLENFDEDLTFLLSLPSQTLPYRVIERMTHQKRAIRMTYDDALSLVNKANVNSDPLFHGQDLKRFHEQILTDNFEGYPIFVTHFPSNLRPFYMKQKGDRALCFDLILPIGGEVAGGSLREDDYDLLKERIQSMGQEEALNWYADLRRTGCSPHGGFGIGLDRIFQSMMHISNIRDTIPFPRWHHQLPL